MDGETFRENMAPYISRPGETVGSLQMSITLATVTPDDLRAELDAAKLDKARAWSLNNDLVAEVETLKRRIAELEVELERARSDPA